MDHNGKSPPSRDPNQLILPLRKGGALAVSHLQITNWIAKITPMEEIQRHV